MRENELEKSIHDFIYHEDFSKFDHHEFPGVVPRTAVPSAIIASAVRLVPACLRNSKYYSLILTRSIIGLLVAILLGKVHQRIRFLFGRSVAIFFMVITLSQPHFIFYASRPLPNIIVMPLGLFQIKGCSRQEFRLKFSRKVVFAKVLTHCYYRQNFKRNPSLPYFICYHIN